MITALTKLAVDELGDGATPLEYVLGYVAGGRTINSLAALLEASVGDSISPAMLVNYLHKQPVPAADEKGAPATAKEAIALAREEGAHLLADQTIDIIDVTPLDNDAISRARLQISARQWVAARWNRKAYGDDKQAPSVLNLGSLHLSVLLAHQPRNEAPKLGTEGIDYEVVKQLSDGAA